MTDREAKLTELAIKWRDAKFAVERAIIEQQLIHAIDMVKKERRDVKVKSKERYKT